jgi:ABC-2 type transport system ATP-binding protein
MVNQEGTTIFMTTHYMDEADLLSDRIALMDHGTIIIHGTPAELKSSLGNDIIYLETSDTEEAQQSLAGVGGIRETRKVDDKLMIIAEMDGARLLPEIIRYLGDRAITVLAVSLKKPSMDDVFMHYTGTEMRD